MLFRSAQKETGASLLIHPGHDVTAPLAVVDVVKAEGGDISRTVIGHLDRTFFDIRDMLKLAETGCYLEFDLFGQEISYYPFKSVDHVVHLPNDAARIDYIVQLVNNGYLNQVIIAQDICNKTSLQTYGGEGYSHIINHVVPIMLEKGLTQEQVNQITIGNPTEALTISN